MSKSDTNAGAGAGRYVRQTAWTRFRRYPAANIVVLYSVFLLTLIVIGLAAPDDFRFLATGNLGVLFQTIPTLGILALGVGLLMIAGEFDLSVAGVYTLAPYLMGVSMTDWGWPLWLAFPLALFVGLTVGVANGLITTRLAIPSFITTLGMMFFLRGVVRFFSSDPKSSSSEQASVFPGETFEAILTGHIAGPLYAQFLWLVLFAVLAHCFLNRHRIGNHFLAVGGNREAAIAVGIDADRVKRVGFVICSGLATFAGIISTTRINSATSTPQLFLELEAIAICVIGGLALTGGRGAIIGIVAGTLILQMVKDVIILAKLPGFYLDMFIGIVIVFGVVLNQIARKKY